MTDGRRDDYEALRAALRDLRAADERNAPSFGSVLARRAPKWSFARPQPRRLAIAAGLVLVAGVAYRGAQSRRERLTVPSEVVALSAWRPYSDVLLETPVSNLLRQAPQLGSSLVNVSITGDFR